MSFGHWPAPNILALYRLDNVNDASGNSHTLTNEGTVTFGLGKFGKCALLGSSNTSKYLSHGDSLGKDLSGAASVSIWFMILTPPSSGAAQTIFTWDSTTGTTRYIQLMYSNDGGTYQLSLDASGTVITYVVTLSANVWYKVDVVIGTTVSLYLNGTLRASGSRGTAITTDAWVQLGNYSAGGSSSFLKGNIDESVFFNVSRTAVDIRRRYAFERGMLV